MSQSCTEMSWDEKWNLPFPKQQKNALFYIWERGDTLHYLFLYKIKERCYFFKKITPGQPIPRKFLEILLKPQFQHRKLGANRAVWDLMKGLLSKCWTNLEIYTCNYLCIRISHHHPPLPHPPHSFPSVQRGERKRQCHAKIPHLVTPYSLREAVSHKQKPIFFLF